jgi:DNA-binding NarL/FixJ family response regulator
LFDAVRGGRGGIGAVRDVDRDGLGRRALPEADVIAPIANGVGGARSRDVLTPETMLAVVSAARIFAFDTGVVRTVSSAAASVGTCEAAVVGSGGFAPREQLVLSLVAAGLSNREIANRLSYRERTIKTILPDVVTKLGLTSRSQAFAIALRGGII